MSIEYSDAVNSWKIIDLDTDFCVVGGGMAGVCAAVAAARNGAQTVLLQDRPVLGGNASSEIRMWVCGAHGVANKEGGILEEILLDNYYYNPELKYTVWDHVLYSVCRNEPNLTLLLNCAVQDLRMDGTRIATVSAWHLSEQCHYRVKAKLFADCSGDSVLRHSGARYRWGREGREEFGESHAPEQEDSKTMGNSILIQLRQTESHTPFRAPAWAYKYTDATCPKRNMQFTSHNFWWLEIGGTQNTIADADKIRDDLMKIAYGVWDYIKNHPDGRGHNWELDWIGALPGKRENVRYVGDHILVQHEVEAGGRFDDMVAYGGWSMDDHHPEAINYPGAPTIFHPAPSPYGIPYRSLYSVNVENLYFAGRNISASHMAMSSTRVMATTAMLGQAIGTAAAIGVRESLSPRGVYQTRIQELQDTLMNQDQYLPGLTRTVPKLSSRGRISHEVLRNVQERNLTDHDDNGIWLEPGQFCDYRFDSPQSVKQVRLVFDSNFADTKRMRCRYPKECPSAAMPGMLIKAFRLEALQGGEWRPVYAEAENHHRLVRVDLNGLQAEGIRLVMDAAWDGTRAHIFAFELQ